MDKIIRKGMLIGIKEDCLDQYKALHSNDNPGVRDLLTKYNFKNFSIFLSKLNGGEHYLFSYYEYTGQNYIEDTIAMDCELRIKEWYQASDPFLIPLNGLTRWVEMEEIYFNT